jgi:hypothetical protein
VKSRKTLIILLVVALLAVYYILGSSYFNTRRSNASLNREVIAATQQLALIPLPPTGLAQRQAAAAADLQTELNRFPAELNTTQILNGILKLAQAAGVNAVPVITQQISAVSANGTNYPAFRLSVDVKGAYAQVAGFIVDLETSQPSTLVIEDISLVATGSYIVNTDGTDGTPVDVLIDIAVYSRPDAKVN